MPIYEDKNFIAKKIKQARKNANLTQSELAEKIGISAKQLSRIEMASFTPSLITFLKILDTLKMDIEEFNILISKETNKTKEELLRIIQSADSAELSLYYDVICAILKNRG